MKGFYMIKRLTIFVGFLLIAVLGYTAVMARFGGGPAPTAEFDQSEKHADVVTVNKQERRMSLWREGVILAEYRIALGAAADDGAKQREGDEKTPEGRYLIDWRNPKSMAYLSLHISYPNPADEASARQNGYAPGGNIMIHGLPNGWAWLGPLHHLWDWTDGCIAVTNSDMRKIWTLVPNGTPIEIR
ncbi:L,D-transpeptidase family protein [Pseudomonas sp. B21-015]|uniref:L,D-transpeptidase family protein n=1 Tax=Pseudomonas sp. B21-015 TaxID=2895473 RepID=UPI00215E07CE|nr:L,D-transpeptidase family protein [Pseudomonas sp. B21-015]UVM48422.1 L,D-transpeptidase family protein [Pseudomonas sp. B21-015]